MVRYNFVSLRKPAASREIMLAPDDLRRLDEQFIGERRTTTRPGGPFQVTEDLSALLVNPQEARSEAKVVFLQSEQKVVDERCVVLSWPAHSVSYAHNTWREQPTR